MKKIVITGGGGQIAYSLLFRIASGELLGPKEPMILNILEIPQGFDALKGVVMELEDCAYPLVQQINIGTDPNILFDGVDIAILIGAKPRTQGMERKDLLRDNAHIFKEQGKALNAKAKKEVCVFVVGNPCNTNCWIAMHNAPDLSPTQFFAMTMLDHNRARAQLAKKAGVPVTAVDRVTIWGNHSATQVPDFLNATIQGKKAVDVIADRRWLENDFFTCVQKRGSAIIQARGKSSAASAANAILDGLKAILFGVQGQAWFSCAMLTTGTPYGIADDLVFSFPCRRTKEGKIEIVPGLAWDPFIKGKIELTEKELIEEKEMVRGN